MDVAEIEKVLSAAATLRITVTSGDFANSNSRHQKLAADSEFFKILTLFEMPTSLSRRARCCRAMLSSNESVRSGLPEYAA